MKSCDNCKYADWKRTRNGRLHPSKEGRCTFKYKIRPMPNAMWIVVFHGSPSNDTVVTGERIYRGGEYQRHCPTYAPKG